MWWLILMGPLLAAALPHFDPTALLQEVLVPADTAVGAVIYRLRASDPSFDYPLIFSMPEGSSVVTVDSLNCSRLNSICQANVVLRRRLEPERFYDFHVEVRSRRGAAANLNCSFRATNATTPLADIFPGAPTLLMVSEGARRNTELGVVVAKGHPQKKTGVLLELWGAPQFGLYQKLINSRDAQGTLLLLASLDYETKTVHHVTVLANDPWTELEKDTRNIAGWPLLIAVLDEQDTPPIFKIAPPTTNISPTLEPGDVVLLVHAEDGDRGKPRDIRYGLVTEGNPLTAFFNISEDTGELSLARPLPQLIAAAPPGRPILLNVVAEEVRVNPQEPPAQSTTVQLALILPGVPSGTPSFAAATYTTLLAENAPPGTVLELPQAEVNAPPGTVVALELLGANGTFDVFPRVVDVQSAFRVQVADPKLLDYELWHSVRCRLVAREVASGNVTAAADLVVLLDDVNDNDPEFSQAVYRGSVQEGAPSATTVLRVEATDRDREPGNRVRYVGLAGEGSVAFAVDSLTGVVSVVDGRDLDAEKAARLEFLVLAADEDGVGRTATATVVVDLVDVNDERPQFEKSLYEFILNAEKNAFTTKAVVTAIDKDITSPNNQVHYELIGSENEHLRINEGTGELYIVGTWSDNSIFETTIRAWDGGIPRLSGESRLKIYPPEGHSRKLVFIVPGRDPDRESVKETLSTLTGSRVTINEIRPYTGHEPGATNVSPDDGRERSVVVATVDYSKDTVVDVNRIQTILDQQHSNTITHKSDRTEEARTGRSFILWLFLILILLALLAALILILCCICQGCPLYVPPKRRKVSQEIQKVIVHGSGQGRESKSVQVAEWFGRREAWSPEHVHIEHEAESLQRHEMERGSDRAPLQRQQQVVEPAREQLYIREGNTDILRLLTRGESQRPITLVQDHPMMVDSGKEILMRRFIEQQQAEATMVKSHVSLPNTVNKLQMENERLLETSLRQQNALLRQILLERERDLRLETQSLPAGTQTDQDMATQTEPLYLRPPRRKVRSDNDASDDDDDEITIIRTRARRRTGRRMRNIKTPIQEESEAEEKPRSVRTEVKQTRTSELRQKASAKPKSSRALHQEVLREISASLERSDSDEEDIRREYLSEDSLDVTPRSENTDSGRVKYHSTTDLSAFPQKTASNKSQSHTDLTKITKKPSAKKAQGKGSSRYMEWYNNSSTGSKKGEESKPKETKAKKKRPVVAKKSVAQQDEQIKESVSRLMKDTKSSSRKKVSSKKSNVGPEHPLLQHSEHRFEARYPPVPRAEEDGDSGIALARPAMAQKKSVFTIAYNGMHTSQLQPDSASP